MVVVLEEWMVLGIGIICFLIVVGSMMLFVTLRNNAPDAFVHWKASRTGATVCRVHYQGRSCRDYIATQDKSEKEIGTNHWMVSELGLKFKPGAEDIEFIEGSIPCVNYYENIPSAIKIAEVTAYSQLKDYFKKIGVPIDGIENIAMYVLSEAESKPKERAILNSRIESEETKKYLRKYLDARERRASEINSLKLGSGIFTFQTAMKSLDGVIAYTSANLAHTKEVIRAAILRSEENKRKDIIMYAIVAFILCIGAAALIVVVGKMN